MPFRRRHRFDELIARQLDLFEAESAQLVEETAGALRAYNRAPADEAEACYERFLDLVDTGRDELAAIRDTYRRTLDADVAEEYEEAFNRAVRRRLPRFSLEIDL